MINLDLLLEKYANIDELINFADQKSDGVIWCPFCINSTLKQYTEEEYYVIDYSKLWDNFSMFMVNEKLFEIVGMFDENCRPAYGEDLDMIYRCYRLKQKVYVTRTSKFYHLGQTTLRNNDGEIQVEKQTDYTAGTIYVYHKWGDIRNGDPNRYPFGNKFIPIKWERENKLKLIKIK